MGNRQDLNRLLEVANLELAYETVQVVWGVSLKVSRGQVVSIIGPNGAGKTTTLKALAGLIPVRKGRIIFDGQDVTSEPAHLRRRHHPARGSQRQPGIAGCSVWLRHGSGAGRPRRCERRAASERSCPPSLPRSLQLKNRSYQREAYGDRIFRDEGDLYVPFVSPLDQFCSKARSASNTGRMAASANA